MRVFSDSYEIINDFYHKSLITTALCLEPFPGFILCMLVEHHCLLRHLTEHSLHAGSVAKFGSPACLEEEGKGRDIQLVESSTAALNLTCRTLTGLAQTFPGVSNYSGSLDNFSGLS